MGMVEFQEADGFLFDRLAADQASFCRIPSLRELSVEVGWSVGAVRNRLRRLSALGFIRLSDHSHRGVEILDFGRVARGLPIVAGGVSVPICRVKWIEDETWY